MILSFLSIYFPGKMMGNLKDFISVVEDGIASNTNIRQTLQEVQKVRNIFKDKHKVHVESKVNFNAGGELLEKYQKDWEELHSNADRNAKAADEVDKIILELNHTVKKRLQTASDFASNLTHLPNITASVAQCMDSMKKVQELLKTVEKELVDFEEGVERSRMEKWKLDHHYQLTLYKDKKMENLEATRAKLAQENVVKNNERDKRILAELQTRHEDSAVAFKQDLALYLCTGSVPVGPTLPPSMTLEQVQLDDDQTDLERFLEDS